MTSWLSDRIKEAPPPGKKAAASLALLQLIALHIDRSTREGRAIEGAQSLGFWFLLRSIEYLADDEGEFDPARSLTWGDLVWRKNGVIVKDPTEADELTITVYSGKGSLHTCTRTLSASGHSTCPIEAIKRIWVGIKNETGKAPPLQSSLFELAGGKVLSRKQMADVLKAGAAMCGISQSAVGTHSLRRGGASHWAACGVPEPMIKRFGRWQSEGYKVYIEAHQDMLRQGVANVGLFMPRFELN